MRQSNYWPLIRDTICAVNGMRNHSGDLHIIQRRAILRFPIISNDPVLGDKPKLHIPISREKNGRADGRHYADIYHCVAGGRLHDPAIHANSAYPIESYAALDKVGGGRWKAHNQIPPFGLYIARVRFSPSSVDMSLNVVRQASIHSLACLSVQFQLTVPSSCTKSAVVTTQRPLTPFWPLLPS